MHNRCGELRTAFLLDSRAVLNTHEVAEVISVRSEMPTSVRSAVIDGQLILLMPSRTEFELGVDSDLPAQALLEHCFENGHVGSLLLMGWLSLIPESNRLAVVDKFATRHLTSDLLDLGTKWHLLSLEVAEAHYRNHTSCCAFNSASAIEALLR